MEYVHTTKYGVKIPLKDLELSHLINIINMIERMSVKGVKVQYGEGYNGLSDDIWYDEEILKGKEALEYLNYNKYKEELERRTNNQPI